MKEKMAKWYKLGLWTAEMIEMAVKKGIITEAEKQEILGNKVE